MRAVASILLLGLVALLAGPASRTELLFFGFLAVGAGVALAALLEGRLSPPAIGLGALAALATVTLAGEAPVLAGGVGLGLAYVPRARLARSPREAALLGALALVAGAAASAVASSFAASSLGVGLAASFVAALLAAAPALVPVDAPEAAALRRLARRCPVGWTRGRLLDGAELLRRLAPLAERLPRDEARRLAEATSALVGLAARVVVVQPGAGPNPHIARLLTALDRVCRAAALRDAGVGQATDEAVADLTRLVAGLEAEAAATAEVATYRTPARGSPGR